MNLRNLTISALALILVAGCEDATGGTGVEPADLVGEWTATSFVLTSVPEGDNTTDVVTMDLVQRDGAVVELMLRADLTYTYTFVSEVEDDLENKAGTYTVAGNILTYFPDDESLGPDDDVSETVGIVRIGDTLTLTMDDHIDLENDEKIDAVLVIILTREVSPH